MKGLKTYFRTFFTNQFVMVFFCLGIALSFYSIRAMYHFYNGNYTVPVVATVLKTAKIEVTNSGGRLNQSYLIHYSYQYEGQSYQSDRYRYSHGTPDDVLQFEPGDTLTAYVNPENPNYAVIRNEFTWTNIVGGVLGVFLILWSFFVHGRLSL